MRRFLLYVAVSVLFFRCAGEHQAQDILVPRARSCAARSTKPNFSSATADIGDPVICI